MKLGIDATTYYAGAQTLRRHLPPGDLASGRLQTRRSPAAPTPIDSPSSRHAGGPQASPATPLLRLSDDCVHTRSSRARGVAAAAAHQPKVLSGLTSVAGVVGGPRQVAAASPPHHNAVTGRSARLGLRRIRLRPGGPDAVPPASLGGRGLPGSTSTMPTSCCGRRRRPTLRASGGSWGPSTPWR